MKDHNAEIVNLKLSRHEVCDILRATTHLFLEFKEEVRDPNTTEERRKIAASSAKYWKDFHDRVEAQLDAFDEANA